MIECGIVIGTLWDGMGAGLGMMGDGRGGGMKHKPGCDESGYRDDERWEEVLGWGIGTWARAYVG